MPAPRVFPREPNSLLRANIKTDYRSQITEKNKIQFVFSGVGCAVIVLRVTLGGTMVAGIVTIGSVVIKSLTRISGEDAVIFC